MANETTGQPEPAVVPLETILQEYDVIALKKSISSDQDIEITIIENQGKHIQVHRATIGKSDNDKVKIAEIIYSNLNINESEIAQEAQNISSDEVQGGSGEDNSVVETSIVAEQGLKNRERSANQKGGGEDSCPVVVPSTVVEQEPEKTTKLEILDQQGGGEDYSPVVVSAVSKQIPEKTKKQSHVKHLLKIKAKVDSHWKEDPRLKNQCRQKSASPSSSENKTKYEAFRELQPGKSVYDQGIGVSQQIAATSPFTTTTSSRKMMCDKATQTEPRKTFCSSQYLTPPSYYLPQIKIKAKISRSCQYSSQDFAPVYPVLKTPEKVNGAASKMKGKKGKEGKVEKPEKNEIGKNNSGKRTELKNDFKKRTEIKNDFKKRTELKNDFKKRNYFYYRFGYFPEQPQAKRTLKIAKEKFSVDDIITVENQSKNECFDRPLPEIKSLVNEAQDGEKIELNKSQKNISKIPRSYRKRGSTYSVRSSNI